MVLKNKVTWVSVPPDPNTQQVINASYDTGLMNTKTLPSRVISNTTLITT